MTSSLPSRFKVITDVHLLWIKNTQVLLILRANTGYMDGYWSLPAGHIEDGEQASIALCRETREEIGITLLPDQVQPSHIMHRKQNDIRISTFWTPTIEILDTPVNCEADRCDKISWFDLSSLTPHTVPYIQHAIGHVQNKVFYSEFGWS